MLPPHRRQRPATALDPHLAGVDDLRSKHLDWEANYRERAVQADMLEEMLQAEAASAMENCALPNRRLLIQILDIHSCWGEIKDPRATIDTCHR
ncbi:hypothetical protein EVAR_38963_1 [Eumeta japonica]|uniref:Uncharacterized protein n=1 Tax=Eumeta variegata TaxID=151549 RepID=A0A4C1WA19_EUMVA|nr:hypothetical protein EVAR_38963_1 [Eumeta japonica]